jgi:hypothetical protein
MAGVGDGTGLRWESWVMFESVGMAKLIERVEEG